MCWERVWRKIWRLKYIFRHGWAFQVRLFTSAEKKDPQTNAVCNWPQGQPSNSAEKSIWVHVGSKSPQPGPTFGESQKNKGLQWRLQVVRQNDASVWPVLTNSFPKPSTHGSYFSWSFLSILLCGSSNLLTSLECNTQERHTSEERTMYLRKNGMNQFVLCHHENDAWLWNTKALFSYKEIARCRRSCGSVIGPQHLPNGVAL